MATSSTLPTAPLLFPSLGHAHAAVMGMNNFINCNYPQNQKQLTIVQHLPVRCTVNESQTLAFKDRTEFPSFTQGLPLSHQIGFSFMYILLRPRELDVTADTCPVPLSELQSHIRVPWHIPLLPLLLPPGVLDTACRHLHQHWWPKRVTGSQSGLLG